MKNLLVLYESKYTLSSTRDLDTASVSLFTDILQERSPPKQNKYPNRNHQNIRRATHFQKSPPASTTTHFTLANTKVNLTESDCGNIELVRVSVKSVIAVHRTTHSTRPVPAPGSPDPTVLYSGSSNRILMKIYLRPIVQTVITAWRTI